MKRRLSKQRLDPLDAVAAGSAWGTSTPAVPSETDPLLVQVPRINEDVDRFEFSRDMFWEELKVLLRYTAPVFGTHLFEYSLQVASIVSSILCGVRYGRFADKLTQSDISQRQRWPPRP